MGILTKIVLEYNLTLFNQIIKKKMKNSIHDATYMLSETRYDNGYTRTLEFLSNKSIDEIVHKNIFYYLYLRHQCLRKNHLVMSFLIYTVDEAAVKYNQEKCEPLYLEYPPAERVTRWFDDAWHGSDELSAFNLDMKLGLWEHYKKQFKYKGEYKVYEIKNHNNFFPEAYKMFVCEELRILYFIEPYELKTQKALMTTLYCDFENSPFFDESILTDNIQNKERYNEGLKELSLSVGYEEMNQETLLTLIEYDAEAKEKLNFIFGQYGYKWGAKNIWKMMEENLEPTLFETCKTYTVVAHPYYYKRFTQWHLFFPYNYSFSSDYEDDRNMKGCSYEALKKRQQMPSLSEYFNVTSADEWNLDTKEAEKYMKKRHK